MKGGLRVSYYYDDGNDPEYSFDKDVGENASTFNAQDKVTWLVPFDVSNIKATTTGDILNRAVKIFYNYIRMNMGDKQLDVNEFASIKSSQINIIIRNVNKLSVDKYVASTGSLGTNSSSGDLFDV